ncbi:DNA replication licensing factor MCM3 [Intoshia linei]|uniref:DNA replication licensing factor MCM3 n=1 Tax=Intoshia linei TaxID=1819745 RepID=A0A177B540_9BILA|nr:DNA replication licensing factor MCM3 [Intoshia linei]
MNQLLNDDNLRDIQREYFDFLDEAESGNYRQKILNLINDGKTRLTININDLRNKNPLRCKSLLEEGFDEMKAFENALKEMVTSIDENYAKTAVCLKIGLEGSFGNKHLNPRSIGSNFLGCIVCVEGIVIRSSFVYPKLFKSVHFCPATSKKMERLYSDLSSVDNYTSSNIYPTKDDQGNLLETEYGLSIYRDHQTFCIQEMPEDAPIGQLPRNIDVIADGDLVDKCKPGDRVLVVGLYRCLPSKKNAYTSTIFRSVVVANSIKPRSKESAPVFTPLDISKITKFSKRKHVFEELAKSIAPTIIGHDYIKKAVLCMLLNGVEKILPNNSRLRGDINILLIGDPSVAKSQILRYVLNVAPRAIATTGRGSSGVGLTAAITVDAETGQRRLEAGAMVLADRGIVCIDEFDKMSDINRTAIHEVMEQGKVNISKAGIHATLNARCNVLAAANPVYGKYDKYKSPMNNIGLQDSLLSRFDLLFIVLDENDEHVDSQIAEHVLRIHRYREPTERDGEVLSLGSGLQPLATCEFDNDEENDTLIYEKYNELLHGSQHKKNKIVTIDFLKKYLCIAKEMKPVMSDQVIKYLPDVYVSLRSEEALQKDENMARTQPITPRTFETLIRLATAHAKCRLSKLVELKDAEFAVEIIRFACFKKVLIKEKRRRRGNSAEVTDEEFESDTEMEIAPSKKSMRTEPKTMSIDGSKMDAFKSTLLSLYQEQNSQTVKMNELTNSLSDLHFSNEEIQIYLTKMSDDNKVMIADDVIYLI